MLCQPVAVWSKRTNCTYQAGKRQGLLRQSALIKVASAERRKYTKEGKQHATRHDRDNEPAANLLGRVRITRLQQQNGKEGKDDRAAPETSNRVVCRTPDSYAWH
jgi:hypothetical protein